MGRSLKMVVGIQLCFTTDPQTEKALQPKDHPLSDVHKKKEKQEHQSTLHL